MPSQTPSDSHFSEGDVLGSHYRIVCKIGEGGMGEVYKAVDVRLNRTVALKILPPDALSDRERRRRFVKEAQAASALDHPGIVTVHDLIDSGEHVFIVMQYVEGYTLRELIDQDRLPLEKALDYAVQLAEAIARAHGVGVVHRDLKPDNLMVTSSGQLKVLDFGLAKLVQPEVSDEAPTREMHTLTREGHILGTAAYMSPEQAEGRRVDARTDVFSFGSVLYEMLSGEKAFGGDSAIATIAAISRDEPKILREHVPTIPVEVEQFVERAMEKRPEARFQTMEAMLAALADLREAFREGKLTPADRAPARVGKKGSRSLAPILASAVLAALAIAFYLAWPRAPDLPPPTVEPLSGLPGAENDPALSPDGNQVAFVWNGGSGEGSDLYIMLTGSGEPLRLTDAAVRDFHPAWSPEGSRIAFLREEEQGYGVFTVPALGGTPRRLTRTTATHRGLSYAPDGDVVAFVEKPNGEGPDAIFLLSTETGQTTQLTQSPPGNQGGDWNPVFSPNGEYVAFLRGAGFNQEDLYVVEASGGEPERLTSDNADIRGLTWTTNGREILFSSTRDGAQKLWRVRASGGRPEAVVVTGNNAHQPTLGRDGNRLVFSQRENVTNIVQSELENAAAVKPLFESTRHDNNPTYSPDGARVAFISGRRGSPEVWVANADGSSPTQISEVESRVAGWPEWSPDGQEIAFVSIRDQIDVYAVSIEERLSRRLTTDPAEDALPSWSADGEWVYFNSNRAGRYQTWKVPASGGEPIRVIESGSWEAYESADGRRLYFAKEDDGGLWVKLLETDEETKLLEGSFAQRWRLGTDRIYFVAEVGGESILNTYDLESGQVDVIATLDSRTLPEYRFSISPRESSLLYVIRGDATSDLYLVNNFR